MFEEPRYIQSSFSITFARQMDIRRKANDLEDCLKKNIPLHYGQPHVVPVPDDMDPQVPRLVFGSLHGYSQIVISQIGMSLNVTYSPDWQTDSEKGREYLLHRVPVLYALMEAIGDVQTLFSGLSTYVRLPSLHDPFDVLQCLRERVAASFPPEEALSIHDFGIQSTTVLDGKYYSNIAMRNYRLWAPQPPDAVPRLSMNKVIESGIEIQGDFNDRRAFNEQDNYRSSNAVVGDIVATGMKKLSDAISWLRSKTP